MKIPIKQMKTGDEPFFNDSNPKAKPDKTINIFSKIFFIIYILSASIVCGVLIYLSVLPVKYLSILIAASSIFAIVFGFFTFKKSSKKLAKILTMFFEFIFTIVFIIIFFYLNHTMNFISSIRASEYQIDNYSILVKKDSKFNSIEDLHYGTVATYDDNSKSYNSALDELAKKIQYKKVEKEDLDSAIKAVATNQTDSLLIKNSLIDLASEIFSDFEIDEYRNLYTITIKTKIEKTETTNIDVTRDSFNIYISGIDTYGDIATISRSDVNMIITVNPRTHTILLTSIPRDYYVQLHGTTGLKDKLTHSGLYGINMTIDTIEDLFNIDINYYIRINFDSTIGLIDALGGIEVTPDITFSRPSNGVYCYYYEGTPNHLDGLCALRYARERKAYGTGDLHRIQNQQEVLAAIINKLTSSKTLLTEYTKILSSLSGSIETNIPSNQIYSLVNHQIDSMPSWHIERISAEGEHIDAPTYTISNENLFVFVPNEESVESITTKIQEVMSAN